MFTGIIAAIGRVESIALRGGSARLRVKARVPGGTLELGESIAVDGICLTVTRRAGGAFEADLTRETLRRTAAGTWGAGRRVNLERALAAGDRLGGHLVQGHIDGVGTTVFARAERGQTTLRVRFPAALAPFIAEKGSIAIDGISLTVSGLGRSWLDVALIPFTLEATNLSDRRPGDPVNLEVDVIARYAARLLEAGGRRASPRIGGLPKSAGLRHNDRARRARRPSR